MGLHTRFIKRLHKKYRALTPAEEEYVYEGCIRQILIYLVMVIVFSIWKSLHAVDFWDCLYKQFGFGFLLAGLMLFYIAYLRNYWYCVKKKPSEKALKKMKKYRVFGQICAYVFFLWLVLRIILPDIIEIYF